MNRLNSLILYIDKVQVNNHEDIRNIEKKFSVEGDGLISEGGTRWRQHLLSQRD